MVADGAGTLRMGGFVAGFRSGAEGPGSSGDPCDANTYYERLRNGGRWDFAEEPKDPEARVGKSGPLFAGRLPADRWLGMKARVQNLPDGKSVRLEPFVDSVSRGDTAAARRADPSFC